MTEKVAVTECGCGAQAAPSTTTCGACDRPLCEDCAEASELDGSGYFCTPCFEAIDP